jgi:hypothetical protein
MSGEAANRRHSSAVERQLPVLREDCARVDGKPFKYFLCPILGVDEDVELCMGHIVNEKCPDSYGGRVVQRGDVDHFYGSLMESDFTSLMRAWAKGPREVFLDPGLGRKMKPRVIAGEEQWKLYPDRGHTPPPDHSRVALHFDGQEPIPWVVQKNKADMDAAMGKGLAIGLGVDCRLQAFVTLLKAAHLTLFKMLGYSYALAESGRVIGPKTLGRFFKDHGTKKPDDARKAALHYFRPYVNMMRPVAGFTGGKAPRGTIEDQHVEMCCTAAGYAFGLVVYVRTGAYLHAVLMPAFDGEARRAAAFWDFLRNDEQQVRLHAAKIDPEQKSMTVSQQWRESTWPKGHETIALD